MDYKLIQDTARNFNICKKGFIEAIALKKVTVEQVPAIQVYIKELEENIFELKHKKWDDKLKVRTIENLETLHEKFSEGLEELDPHRKNESRKIVRSLRKNINKLMEMEAL
jgi:hypothetical protein